jgi:hypothetical protein
MTTHNFKADWRAIRRKKTRQKTSDDHPVEIMEDWAMLRNRKIPRVGYLFESDILGITYTLHQVRIFDFRKEPGGRHYLVRRGALLCGSMRKEIRYMRGNVWVPEYKIVLTRRAAQKRIASRQNTIIWHTQRTLRKLVTDVEHIHQHLEHLNQILAGLTIEQGAIQSALKRIPEKVQY